MIAPHRSLSGRLIALLATVVLLVAGVHLASPAIAADEGVCTGPDRYLLLTDPTGLANQALCRTQERVLEELSEEQWGIAYSTEQRHRILRWGRQEALGAMYLEVLRIAQERSVDRTADEATVYTWLQQTVAALRSRLANGAYAEWLEWNRDPCGYVNPTPGAAAAGCDPDSLVTLFGQPPGPSYEEFVSYGARRVLGEELPGSQLAIASAAARSAKNQLVGALIGGVAAFPVAGGLVAAVMIGAAAQGLFATAAALSATGSAAAVAAGTAAVGTTIGTAAASIAFVVIAIVAAVVRGIQVFDQAKIPGQLRDDIDAADDPVDIAQWIGEDGSRASLVLYALTSRLDTRQPAVVLAGAPAADAPGFLVRSGADDTVFTRTIRFRSPVASDEFYSAWLDHGWWVIRDDDGGLAMTRDLVYVDHDHVVRSASPTADGFLVTAPAVSAPTIVCDAATLCEQTTALRILTPPTGDTDPFASTATLLQAPIAFTNLPDIAESYAVGDTIESDGLVRAEASYLTTMSYRWELVRHAAGGDQISRIDGNHVNRTLTMPGDYRLSVVATAASGETARHDWSFTVTGDAEGQLAGDILLTQYPADSATPEDEPGPWAEGATGGTLCLSTGATEPTDFTLKYVGEPAMVAEGVTAGYACFPGPEGARVAGVHLLDTVQACRESVPVCVAVTAMDYADGQWIQRSPFSYTVKNVRPNLSTVRQGVAGGPLAETVPSHPTAFDRADTIEVRSTVTDPGGGPLTVRVRWSDGTGETLTDVDSGQEIALTHAYQRWNGGPVGVQLQAVDGLGETSNLETGFFYVRPVSATLDLDATADATGLATLTGSFADEDGTASHLVVEWGDGSHDTFTRPFPAPLGAAAADDILGRFSASHRYATGGAHVVKVTIVNGAPESGTGTTTVTVPNTAPAVASDGEITVSEGREVSFDALVGDLNPGDPLALRIDYGDGETDLSAGHATGEVVGVRHVYGRSGRYRLVLTAVDAAGLESEPVTRCVVVGHDVAAVPCPGVLPGTDDELRGLPRGDVTGPGRARAGQTITVHAGSGAAGHHVSAWIYSTPTALGSFVAGPDGTGALTIPAKLTPGAHAIALVDGGILIGWFPIEILPAAGSSSGEGTTGHGSGGPHHGPGQLPSLPATGSSIGIGLLALMMLTFLLGGVLVRTGRRGGRRRKEVA